MSLREELAARFENLADAYVTTIGAGTPDELRSVYADECIRQMEWVRQKFLLERIADARHDAPRWAHEVYCDVRDADLTLAPEDWKP